MKFSVRREPVTRPWDDSPGQRAAVPVSVLDLVLFPLLALKRRLDARAQARRQS